VVRTMTPGHVCETELCKQRYKLAKTVDPCNRGTNTA
jgi:hypothetical protein